MKVRNCKKMLRFTRTDQKFGCEFLHQLPSGPVKGSVHLIGYYATQLLFFHTKHLLKIVASHLQPYKKYKWLRNRAQQNRNAGAAVFPRSDTAAPRSRGFWFTAQGTAKNRDTST